jgi:hypothetical protein
MPHGKPPRHPGTPLILNNNGKPKVISSENGIATEKLIRLPTGELVKKLRPPPLYRLRHFTPVTRNKPFKPHVKPIGSIVRHDTLTIKPSMPGLNYNGNENGAQSPPIPSRYGGSRKKRRYTKRRGRN